MEEDMIFEISIHALLAESDTQFWSFPRVTIIFLSTLSLRRATYAVAAVSGKIEISIHALLAESDLCHHISKNAAIGFLSTLSLRRATATPTCGAQQPRYFYPRSPCGERPDYLQIDPNEISISIHALLAESDRDLSHHTRQAK